MRTSTEPVVLVINGGSSSLKFAIYPLKQPLQAQYRGQIDRIGGDGRFQVSADAGQVIYGQSVTTSDHGQAMQLLLDWLATAAGSFEIAVAGHRVVHGGAHLAEPTLINDDIVAYLHTLIPLAPNHQPPSLQGIAALQRLQPGLTQIACFDTAFHHGRPPVEQYFALPRRPELEAVRRFGFHGLSYEYIANVLPEHLGETADGKIIIAHLGHGASLCALQRRHSVATTMTFTPLDGIPMGTRCGAIDPAVVLYLQQQGMQPEQVSDLLYFQSGLLGISGSSDDMLTLLEQDSPGSRQAIEQFVHHSVRAIGSLAAALQGLDALVFTAGIGEHAASIREAICTRCEWLGLELDASANNSGHACISDPNSPVQAWVIGTDEERMIAEHSLNIYNTQKAETLS